MNSRAKGRRSVYKALDHIQRCWPEAVAIVHYQPSQWATPMPWDVTVFRMHRPPLLVEVRSNQWGVSKDQTTRLTQLPGVGYSREIWRFRNGSMIPDRRCWHMGAWHPVTEHEDTGESTR